MYSERLATLNERMDGFIHVGMATLADLKTQRSVLKGTQRRMLSLARTLGMSQAVIRWIEVRSAQDKYVFYTGVLVTLLTIVLVCLYIL